MAKILLALFVFTFVVYYSSKEVKTQENPLVCFTEEQALANAKKEKQRLLFTGINLNNQPFELWASSESYVLLILLPDGTKCTSTSLIGFTISNKIGNPT